jgi:ABC-type transport system substrate-binding protein
MSAPRLTPRRTTAVTAALIALSVGASACQSKTHLAAAGSSDSAGSTGTTSNVAAGGSGTLNWEWALPTSWDPVTSTAGWDVHVLSLVYSSLTGLDPSGKAVPAVATSWKYGADGKSITFTLQSGLKFSDGTTLDAAAVKTNIERGRDFPNSRIASQLREVKDVVVKSPTEVELDLAQVDYQIPNLLAGKTGMLVSPAAIAKDAKSLSTKPVGDGPFTLATYVPDSHADLVRNPGYYNAANIKLAKFSVKKISEPQQILAALQSGDVNVAVIPGSLAKAAQAAGFTINEIPALTVNTLDVNTTKAPFNNPKVLEAVNYAIDRQALVDTQEFGHGTASYQPFPKGYVGYSPALANLYPHDVAKAKQLLAEAGYPNGLSFELTTSKATGISEQLQSQLKEAGITATLKVIPADQFTNIVYVNKTAAIAIDGTAGRESPLQMLDVLYSPAGLMNATAAQPSDVGTLFNQVRGVSLDSPSYQKTLQAAVDAAVKSPTSPHIWLYAYPRLLATSKKVTGLQSDLVVQRFEGTQVAQ